MLGVGFFLVRCECLLRRGETLDEFHLGGMVSGEGACEEMSVWVWDDCGEPTFVDFPESLSAQLADDGSEDAVGDQAAVEGRVAILHEGVHVDASIG